MKLDNRAYYIAEIGINHNGDLDLALKMIDAAKAAGADCVKFQKRNPDVCVPEEQKNKPRKFLGEDMTYLEYKKKIEFEAREYDIINEHCKKIGIDWTASVWDVDSVWFMSTYKFDIPFIKVPSACITDLSLLRTINHVMPDVPVFFSTGMSTQDEVDQALDILDNVAGIMICNSSYPCKNNEIDLNVLKTYKLAFSPLIAIGYSGHEEGYLPSLTAVAMDADIIERHFTIDKTMEGTDQKASLEPEEFGKMVKYGNEIKAIQGGYSLHIYPAEKDAMAKLRNRTS